MVISAECNVAESLQIKVSTYLFYTFSLYKTIAKYFHKHTLFPIDYYYFYPELMLLDR